MVRQRITDFLREATGVTLRRNSYSSKGHVVGPDCQIYGDCIITGEI